MKIIDIRTRDDYYKLKNLEGKENILLKIWDSTLPHNLKTISLKDFRGTIQLSFENKKKRLNFAMKAMTDRHICFFEDYQKCNIIPDYEAYCDFSYQITKQICQVKNEQEFLSAISKYKKGENIEIQITDTFGISNLFEMPQGINIVGNFHTLFLPFAFDCSRFLKSFNLYVAFYDKFISIKSIEDFVRLQELKNGVVYVEVKKDLTAFKVSSISLEDFQGTLYINGKGHVLQNGVVKNDKSYGGLISSLSSQSGSYIHDWHIKNVNFKGKTEYSGSFLGTHNVNEEKLQSTPERVVFSNCSVQNCFFSSPYKVGSFIGKADEFIELLECYATGNFTPTKNVITCFGNYEKEFFIPCAIESNNMLLQKVNHKNKNV